MNNLPPGFIMGFWVKAKDKNPQSMHFTAPKKLFGVLRDGLRGLPLNGSGPLAATQERAVTHGATEWKLDFSLSDAPGLEGLLYLFDSEDGAATYQRSCGKPWDQAALLPLLDQKLLPDVAPPPPTPPTSTQMGRSGGQVARKATLAIAQTATALVWNRTTVRVAAPGSPPEWIP